MRVLVTGGAGFVGSHTVDLLLSGGLEVVVLDNLDPQVHVEGGFPVNLRHHARNPRLEFIHGDVRDARCVARALQGVEGIVHLAAAVGVGQSMYEPLYYTDVNLTGTATLLQAILKERSRLRKLVVASSMSIYGEGLYRCVPCAKEVPMPSNARRIAREWEPLCPDCRAPLTSAPTHEAKPLQPSSIYAITKRTQEEMILCFGRSYGVPVVALRYFNIYGSRQALTNPYTGVIAIFMSRLLNDRPPLVFEDGLQSRDFINVQDIARANLCALTASTGDCDVLNVGTGRPTTVLALARLLADALHVDVEPTVLNRVRMGDIRHCYANASEIRRRLGWEARIHLRDGLHDLLEWARGQQPADRADEAVLALTQRGLVR